MSSAPNGDEPAKGFVKKVTTDELLSSFLSDVVETERQAEIDRIMQAVKLDPFAVLGIDYDATQEFVNKHFRSVSLLIHPDKVPEELKETAQTAFNYLNAAKADFMDRGKRDNVLEVAMQVKNTLLPTFKDELRKRRRLEGNTEPVTDYDVEQQPDFREKWKAETREKIIEREWEIRQFIKKKKQEVNSPDCPAAPLTLFLGGFQQEDRVQRRKEKEKQETESKKERDQEWENVRSDRVDDWRKFTANGKRKRKDIALPTRFQADEQASYIRRPVTRDDGVQRSAPQQKDERL